jgi:hypothetical protein
MMLRKSILLFVFLLAAQASGLAQKCLSYEPAEVRLRGRVSRQTFPGPPNYENIKKGDKPETYWVLHLDTPICVAASADNDAESGVTDLQLILSPGELTRFKSFVRRRLSVRIVGRLSHAITGHHHTPVLLEVKGFN